MNPEGLKRTQANQILNLLQQNGLAPEEFEWKRTQFDDRDYLGHGGKHEVDMLVRRSSQYYFVFGTHSVQFSPGDDSLVERVQASIWESKVMYAVQWMNHLKGEYSLQTFGRS